MTLIIISALAVGLTLGLLGSGGAILTVPILTYLVEQDPKVAIASSLLIVGTISIFALIPHALKKQLNWKIALIFGIPGILGATLSAWSAQFIDSNIQMLVFSILLITSSYLMFKPSRLSTDGKDPNPSPKIAIIGFLVGITTGIIGVGGGFLIIPALILILGMPIHIAIGTSLLIIAMNSFAGFTKYLYVLEILELQLDWKIIAIFASIGIIGSWIGASINNKINQDTLKKGFGVFLILIAFFILYKNLPSLF